MAPLETAAAKALLPRGMVRNAHGRAINTRADAVRDIARTRPRRPHRR